MAAVDEKDLPSFGPKKGWPKGKPRGPRIKKPIPEVVHMVPGRDPIREQKNLNPEFLKDDDEENLLHIPRNQIPEGFDIMWVTGYVHGQEFPSMRMRREKRGWQPVQIGDFEGRYDHFMPKGYKGEIRIDDCVLYSRPIEYSIAARKRDRQRAIEQVRLKENQFMGGGMEVTLDASHKSALAQNRMNTSWERIPVPKDEDE